MSSLEFRLKKKDEMKNSLLEEIKHNDLISEKYKETCKYLSYIELFPILALTTTGSVSVSAICFIILCPCWYYKFCRRNNNLCNHCRNLKV